MAEEKTVGQELMTENERLREENKQLREAIRRIADQDATLSVCDGNVTVTIDAFLTPEEREALQGCINDIGQYADEMALSATEAAEKQAPFRALLERTK